MGLPSMSFPRAFRAAAATGGRVYALGGIALGDTPQHKLQSVEALAVAGGSSAGSWMPMLHMIYGRQGHGAGAIDGVVFAVGGVGALPGYAVRDLAQVEKLDTTTTLMTQQQQQ